MPDDPGTDLSVRADDAEGRALLRILDGERAPALARNLGPVQAAVVIAILFHLPPASQP